MKSKQQERKRLIRNDEEEEMKAVVPQEQFDRFAIVDQERNRKEQITSYIGRQALTPVKKGPIVFEATEIRQRVAKTSYTNLWGDEEEEEELNDDEQNDDFVVTNTDLINLSRAHIINTQTTQPVLSQEPKAETKGVMTTNPSKSFTEKPLHTEVRSSMVMTNPSYSQPIEKPPHTEVRSSMVMSTPLTSSRVSDKPLQGQFYILLENTLKLYQPKIVKEILLSLGGKSCLPQFVSPDAWCVTGNAEAIKKGKPLLESDLNQYFVTHTGKTFDSYYEAKNPVEEQPKPVQQEQPANSGPFFGKEAREIQKTQEIVTVMRMIEEKPRKEKESKPEPRPEKKQQPAPKGSLWTEKYKPQSFSQCVGNDEAIQKLTVWLKKWGTEQQSPHNQSQFKSANTSAKAALLSGPPGIGKTTSVRVVAKLLDYHLLEWNASDVRSRLAIENGVSHLRDNTTIQRTQKTLILMDEVDGMSGSDKGGSKALIEMIKKTKVPIVCVCNDRHDQKIRSLSAYCLDLKFNRPAEKQVIELLKSICQAESVPFSDEILLKRVRECQCDIRQLITLVQVSRNLYKDDVGGKDTKVVTNIFDATKGLLSYNPSIRNQLDLYFVDNGIVPLLYQENYLYASKDIESVSKAADSIAQGDIFTARIRRANDWSLLPQAGFLSTVYPSHMLRTPPTHMRKIEFTQYLGKMSVKHYVLKQQTIRKQERLLQEFRGCVAPNFYGIPLESIRFRYLETLAFIFTVLVRDREFERATLFLRHHNIPLTMAQESLMEILCLFPKVNPFKRIDPSIRAQFTKYYKSTCDSAELGDKAIKQRILTPIMRVDEEEENLEDIDEEEHEQPVAQAQPVKKEARPPAKGRKKK